MGSEWLYIKIYTGNKTSNRILCDFIRPLTKKLKKRGVEDFFYIRYEDPDFHLRLRFHVPNRNNYSDILSELYKILDPLVEARMVKRVSCDMYNRELERYDPSLIETVKKIFSIDSETTLELLSVVSSPNETLFIAIQIVDQYLSLLGMGLEEKLAFTTTLSDAFMDEFHIKNRASYTKQFNDKYRIQRNNILNILSGNSEMQPAVMKIFHKRERMLQDQLTIVQKYYHSSKKKLIDKETLLESLIHMSMNRLFYSYNRLNEFIIYYYLMKSYNSIIKQSVYEKECRE